MAIPMGSLKIEMENRNETGNHMFCDDPATWGPPESPLDMPYQQLERRSGLFDTLMQLRLLFTGQRI